MAELARDIANMGALPGIWFRPLLTAESLPGELFLKTPPSSKQAAARRLDPSHPEALAIIRQDVSRLAEWGYRLIKHDFSTIDLTGGAVPEESWTFRPRRNHGADHAGADSGRSRRPPGCPGHRLQLQNI
jgi:alpha-galactosidase